MNVEAHYEYKVCNWLLLVSEEHLLKTIYHLNNLRDLSKQNFFLPYHLELGYGDVCVKYLQNPK